MMSEVSTAFCVERICEAAAVSDDAVAAASRMSALVGRDDAMAAASRMPALVGRGESWGKLNDWLREEVPKGRKRKREDTC